MIIFGTRSAHIETKQLPNIVCPKCTTQGSTMISIYRRHLHVFWIPTLPIGKTGTSHCQHCKQSLHANEMPTSLEREYKNLKTKAKGPIWQFSGLFVVTALIVLVGFAVNIDNKNNSIYLDNPLIGDVYEYQIANKQYSTMKVVEVSNDSLFMSLNDYEINKSTRIYKIDKPENYPQLTFGFSKQEIKELYISKKIIDINRN
ncbi:hypothetical protein H0I23_00765 [Cellulophaga sp. HaHaR_3_176]|uniref:zinc ribbon domain-containing protein n=1 Tax=Cellulophaga sp. HaHaR_3_176 TaxID=1942464 RepID=UPI001C1F3FC0|nr:zinc ribbon domain-containing protein [Cellulophaga sp. HaHaR_3_176]QWX84215.1 hypothetical protein H0I23_00765 [Cellulophaga sp. HaHaR_3_176]